MAFLDTGGYGVLARASGGLTTSLANKGRGYLQSDPASVSGVRAVLDQFMVTELHTGKADLFSIFDQAGDSMADFSGSGSTITLNRNVIIDGTLSFVGNPQVIVPETFLVKDNLIVVNSTPGGTGYSSGILANRSQSANQTGAGDVVADTAVRTSTLQSNSSTTVVIIDSGASASDDAYNNYWFKVSQSGHLLHNQVRLVSDYTGASNTLTLATAFTSVNATGTVAITNANGTVVGTGTAFTTELAVGDRITVAAQTKTILSITNDTLLTVSSAFSGILSGQTLAAVAPGAVGYKLYDRPYVGLFYDEAADRWCVASTAGDPGQGPVVKTDYLPFAAGSLTVLDSAGTQKFNVTQSGTASVSGDQIIKGGGTGAFIVAGGSGGGTLSLRTNGTGSANGMDFASNGAITAHQQFVIDSGGLTMTGLDIGGASAEIGNIFMDGAIRYDAVADPTPVANKGFLYMKLVSGNPELFWLDEVNAAVQITAGGALNTSGSGCTLDSAYDFGGAGSGRSITVDSGALVLSQAKTTENTGTLSIVYAASAFTGTANSINVDWSAASSFSNGSDIYGAKIVGATNAGAGNSVGLRIASFDVGIENTCSLAQSGASVFTGNVSQTTGTYTYNVAASAYLIDSASYSIDSTSASNVSVTGGNLTLSTLTSGTLAVTSAGALNLTSAAASAWAHSGGAFSITSTSQSMTLATATSGTLAVTSAGALNLTSAAASTWAHSGGALAITSTSQNFTLSTATSGTLAVTSAGALNHTSAAASTWTHSGGAFAINSTSQSLTLATVTSGTMALTSAGALNATSAAASTWTHSGGAWALTSTSQNVTISTVTSGIIALTSAGALNLSSTTGDWQGSGALTIDSTGGAISIGSDADAQAMNWGTGAAARTLTYGNVTGATAQVFKAGTGGFSFIEAGLSNSSTNAPGAANDVVFLTTDGLSKADAAAIGTSFVKGAYTGTSGQCKKGTELVFTKMFTNAGGTTYDNIAKGDLIWLAAAVASEYDSGVTPAKGRCSNRAPSGATSGSVNFILGAAAAASDGSTATVSIDFHPMLLSVN